MPYLIGFYTYLCLIVAILGRRSRLGFFRSLVLALAVTPVLAVIFIFLFSPARIHMLPRAARKRLLP